MRSQRRIVVGLIVLVVSAGAAFGQASGKAEDAILAADAAWMKVYHAKDLARSVAFCDEQGSMLAPNVPIATGRDALVKAIASDFVNANLTWHANKVGVARSGDLGYTSGTYDNSFKDPSGKTIYDKGKYLTVWKKQADGEWKVLYDVFNSDLPAPIRGASPDEQRAVHNSSGPVLSRQVGDILLAMRGCTPTGDPGAEELAFRCVGSIENKGEFKIRVEVTNGRVIDDHGNEHPLWTTGPWGGPVVNFHFGAGCCAEELIPGLPVKFDFGLDHMKRDTASINLVLDFISSGSSGSLSRSEAVFKGVPIRSH
jgi:ketosteroid isomerase-like protein